MIKFTQSNLISCFSNLIYRGITLTNRKPDYHKRAWRENSRSPDIFFTPRVRHQSGLIERHSTAILYVASHWPQTCQSASAPSSTRPSANASILRKFFFHVRGRDIGINDLSEHSLCNWFFLFFFNTEHLAQGSLCFLFVRLFVFAISRVFLSSSTFLDEETQTREPKQVDTSTQKASFGFGRNSVALGFDKLRCHNWTKCTQRRNLPHSVYIFQIYTCILAPKPGVHIPRIHQATVHVVGGRHHIGHGRRQRPPLVVIGQPRRRRCDCHWSQDYWSPTFSQICCMATGSSRGGRTACSERTAHSPTFGRIDG